MGKVPNFSDYAFPSAVMTSRSYYVLLGTTQIL